MAGLRSAGALLHPCRPPSSRPSAPRSGPAAGAPPAARERAAVSTSRLATPPHPRSPEPLSISTFVFDMKSLAYAPASSML